MRQKTRDMTQGIIWKQLLFFALPLILGDLLQVFYSTVDSIIVGRFVGKQALAAVTGTELVVNIVVAVFTGLSMGATIVMSQLFGAKKNEDLHAAVQSIITLTFISTLVVSAFAIICTPLLLRLLGTPDDVFPEARNYLAIFFGGLIGLIFYNVCSSILRAVGNTQKPLVALAITSVLNIFLDIVFVMMFEWGVRGAAIATIISEFVSALYLFILLCKTDQSFGIDIKHLKLDPQPIKSILSVGVPFTVQKTLVFFSNTLIIAHVNSFGSGAMAAWGVYKKADTLITNIDVNLAAAMTSFVGQNYGAKKYERIRDGRKSGFALGLVVTAFYVITMLFARKPIIRLFNRSEDVLEIGEKIFIFLVPFQFISTINQILSGCIRGYGDSKGPMLVFLISQIGIRQLYINIAWKIRPTLMTAVACYPVGWIATIIGLVVYHRWKQKEMRLAASK